MKHLFFLSFCVFCIGCTYFKNQSVIEPVAEVSWHNFDSSAIDQVKLMAGTLTRHFYRENNFKLVWVDTGGVTQKGDSMLRIIRDSKFYGLIPEHYHRASLDAVRDLPFSHDHAVVIDVCLTDSFFAMYHHLKNGRIDKKSLNLIDLANVPDTSAIIALREALSSKTVREQLETQEPVHPQYHLLKAELRNMLDRGDDPQYEKHADQLMINMERWRWQTKPMPDRYVTVNMPSFMLKIVEQDSVFLSSKVIVGKKETPTPELESVIRSFIIYPYWHVPRSIVKEILPGIQADSLYLRKHNYEVLDRNGKVVDASTLDWPSFSENNFPYVLRQREGSENTMGVIKFVFNNNYGIYLHDTNARGLFWRDKRALSHGCIRVHKAVALAHYLARDDDTYVGPEDLDQYLLVQHKMTVNVVKPIPVLLQYFTASVEQGKAVFYDDIYGKDQEVMNALYHLTLHASQEQVALPFLQARN